MTFVAVPTPTPPAPPSSPAQLLEHDGWYPATDPAQLRDVMRVTETVTEARLAEAVFAAQDQVGRELRAWRATWEAAGAASLEAVDPDTIINFEPAHVGRYRRAVFNLVMAELVETYRDVTATKDGSDRAEQRALSADEYRRNALYSIRDILGVTRTTVELI